MKHTLVRVAAAAALLGGLATAQIERLTLAQMVEKTDGALVGRITGSEVTRVEHPAGGGPLYFTTLHVQGTTLPDGAASTVSVSYPGGFVDDEEGVWNSEAPTADETKTGREVVVFWKWSDDMGGGFASNALYASHGGLFTTFSNRKGDTIVQGRGDGYAVPRNVTLAGLREDVARIERELERKKEGENGGGGR